MEITVLPSLTPFSRSPSPTLFCPEVLYYKLKRLTSQRTWPVPKAFVYEYSPTEVTSQILSTRRVTPQAQNQSFEKSRNYPSDGISSRLPARSRATMHRSTSIPFNSEQNFSIDTFPWNRSTGTSIAHRLRSRSANPKTWRRRYGRLLH